MRSVSIGIGNGSKCSEIRLKKGSEIRSTERSRDVVKITEGHVIGKIIGRSKLNEMMMIQISEF